jgi:hypothetical protein
LGASNGVLKPEIKNLIVSNGVQSTAAPGAGAIVSVVRFLPVPIIKMIIKI